jgi:hypothetical protein
VYLVADDTARLLPRPEAAFAWQLRRVAANFEIFGKSRRKFAPLLERIVLILTSRNLLD